MRPPSVWNDYPRAARWALVASLLVLPWLVPAAPGPSSNVVPWLVGAACAVAAWLLTAPASPPRAAFACAGVALAFALLRPGGSALDRAAFAGGVALLLLALAIGRGGRRNAIALLLATSWLAAALLSALVGLLQYFELAGSLQPWVHSAAAGEAIGNLRQRNQLASLLAIGLAATLWFAGRTVRMRWLLPAVLLLAVGSAATTSRTGLLHWLALAALAVVWQGEARRARLLLCGAGLAAYAAAAWLLPLLLESATGAAPTSLAARVGGDAGCSSRGVLWSNVLQLVAQRPLLGWGWGELDYAHYMNLYGGERFCDILDNAHNLPLHIAVELGVPAALLFCGGVLYAVRRARPWAEPDDGARLGWSVLAVLLVHSLLEYPLWYAPFQLAAGLALGLLLPGRRDVASPVPARRMAPVAVACAALLAYAGWDYLRVSQIYLEPQQRLPAWQDDTLAQARRSWLFAGQARFAELTLTPLTPRTVDWVDATAQEMLHYSPEPRVIEQVIASATMKERYDDAVLHLARYRAAFPQDYGRWRQAQKLPLPLAPRTP